MIPSEKAKNIGEQKRDCEALIITWTNAIRSDVKKESLKTYCPIGDDTHTVEAKVNNEDGILHTLAFLQKYPDFNVNVLMHQCKEDALQWSLTSGSMQLTQLLLEHNANPHSTPSYLSPLYQINMQLNAFRSDTGKSLSFLLDNLFKSQMELGREKLELMLCYGYRPSEQNIKKLYEHYIIDSKEELAPSKNENNNNGTENGIASTVFSVLETIPLIGIGVEVLKRGVELYRQRRSQQERSLPEPIYDPRQFIMPIEFSSRLQAAIKDIEAREKNNPLVKQATSIISEGMVNAPMPLANIVYQYSDIVLKIRKKIYEQRKAEGFAIAFRYTLR